MTDNIKIRVTWSSLILVLTPQKFSCSSLISPWSSLTSSRSTEQFDITMEQFDIIREQFDIILEQSDIILEHYDDIILEHYADIIMEQSDIILVPFKTFSPWADSVYCTCQTLFWSSCYKKNIFSSLLRYIVEWACIRQSSARQAPVEQSEEYIIRRFFPYCHFRGFLCKVS